MYVYGTCLFYVCCSDCVWGCGNVCCVVGFLSLGVLKYGVCLYKGVMYVVFSVCIVTRGAVDARVWEV